MLAGMSEDVLHALLFVMSVFGAALVLQIFIVIIILLFILRIISGVEQSIQHGFEFCSLIASETGTEPLTRRRSTS